MKTIAPCWQRRLSWINLPLGLLLALLQRTPAVRVVAAAGNYVIASPVGQVLRAAFTLATLGAMHSRAGATTYVQSPANPVTGTVGSPVSVGFAFTGAPSEAQHWVIQSGQLPPGLTFVPAASSGIIQTRDVAITGTPTQAGNFSVTVQAIGLAGQSDHVTIMFQITGGATTTAPTITTQPQNQAVTAGGTATFTVAATGSPAPTYQWRKDGTNLNGATNATLSVPNVQAANAGVYTVVVTNSAGSATSAGATLTVTPAGGGAPVIVSQPLGFTAAPGGTVALAVVASGGTPTYQWRKDGANIAGATGASLTLSNVSAANAGAYSVVVTTAGGSVTSSAANVNIAAGESRLANLSVRANLGTGQELIVGFVTNGSRSVLLRGIGPTLGAFGVSGAYADPRLELFDGTTMIMENEDWSASLVPAFDAVGAFPLTNGSKDAALQTTVTGLRTAQLKGPSSGVALVEVYDSGSGNAVRLVNVSARNFVGTGDDILIAGFVINGSVAKTLLIRAVGPTLASFGVGGTLPDPKLEIYTSAPAKVVENDNWAASLLPVFNSVGAFELLANSNDAALLVTLPPGAYSAQVSGAGSQTGEALVEVYEVP